VTQTFSRLQKTSCLAGLFLAWAVGYADRILMSTALVPISQEFALNAREAGMLLSAFYISYALMQLVGGWLSDRFGSRIVVVMCIVMWSVFTGATSLAWSFASLLAIRFLFGVGEGSFSPASSVTVAEVFPKPERARAKSFLISTVYLGNAAGSGLIVLTVAKLGWRGSFEILSVIGIVVAAILWMSLRGGMSGQRERRAERPRVIWREVLRMPMAWRLCAIWFFTSMLYVGVQSWMPSYLLKAYGIDLKQVGMAVAVTNLIAFAGGYYVGVLLDRYGKTHERLFLVMGALMGTIFFALMITTSVIWLLLVYWTLFLLSFNFVYATVFAAPLRHVPEHLIGSTSGLMNFGGQMGNTITPIVTGALIAASGGAFFSAFWVLLAAGALSVVAAATWRVSATPSGNGAVVETGQRADAR
jgi:MFS transporter, ACS family, hexuronate transporter